MNDSISVASTAVSVLRQRRLILWTPGDGIAYRVVLVDARSDHLTLNVLLVTLDTSEPTTHIILKRPNADFDLWTPKTFVSAVSLRCRTWWPAIRPILAALGWTPEDDRDTSYRYDDMKMIRAVVDSLN